MPNVSHLVDATKPVVHDRQVFTRAGAQPDWAKIFAE
jgi:hypothetical protein